MYFGKIYFDKSKIAMQEPFRGRTSELRILENNFQKKGFVMTILYGRRRIGKTRLINKFINSHNCKCISFTALERGDAELLSMLTESVLNALAPDLLGTVIFNSFENSLTLLENRQKRKE